MSRLGPHFRPNGKLRLNIGVGELVDPIKFGALNCSATGAIYAVSNGTIDHYADGLPFNLHGRLVITESPVEYVDQGTPFSSTGAVCIAQTATDYVDQGHAFDTTGNMTRN